MSLFVRDTKLGDVIMVYVYLNANHDLVVSDRWSAALLTATVVYDASSAIRILGWKPNESATDDAVSIVKFGSNIRSFIEGKGFDRFAFAWCEYMIGAIVSSGGQSLAVETPVIKASNGMKCSHCEDFNSFAEANRGDKYVCFSCRSSGH